MTTDRLDPLTRRQPARDIKDLTTERSELFSHKTIEQELAEQPAGPSDSKVQTFLTFVRRFTRQRLRSHARPKGVLVTGIPEVLFVCVHNAGRSQMAAGLLAKHAKGRINVRSAGSAPADEVNPAVVRAMTEVGVDLSQEFPKPLTDELARTADVLVTMGCGDACPVYPGKRYLDWELPDPAGHGIDAVRPIRPIRDDINRRVLALIDKLLGHPPT